MAEPNPQIANAHIPIPEGDDEASKLHALPGNVGRNAPVPAGISAPNDADDYIHLNNLQKNSPVSSGDDDNADLSMAVNGDRNPVDNYTSRDAGMNPLW